MKVAFRLLTSRKAAVVLAAVCAPAYAQTPGNLANLPGLGEVERPTAAAIQTVCARFAPAGFTANVNGTLAERLFYSCREMVQTANQLANSGGTGASLRISGEQLVDGVRQVAPVQLNAQKQINVEGTKNNLLISRLLELRGGGGVVVSRNGETATGGAASSDPPLRDRYGVFVNLGYNTGDVDGTERVDPYDFDSVNLLAGFDVRISENFVVGGAVNYNKTDSDFDRSLGKVDAQTVGVAGYGTYFVDAWYVDGFVSYGSVDYDTTRNIAIPSNSSSPLALPINTSATASPKGHQWSASVGVGRSYDMRPVTISPSARLTYLSVKNKAFTEDEPLRGLGLEIEERTVRSLQSALGVKLSSTISSAVGVFVPYVAFQWIHEFKNDSPDITAKYVADPFDASTFFIPTENPDRNYGTVLLGSSATFPNNWSGFAQFMTAVGLSNVKNHGFVVGVRKQF